MVDSPWIDGLDSDRIVVDIDSGIGMGGWERHDWDAVAACEAAGLLARSWFRPVGLHFEVTVDSRLGDEALGDVANEVVDTVLDTPS